MGNYEEPNGQTLDAIHTYTVYTIDIIIFIIPSRESYRAYSSGPNFSGCVVEKKLMLRAKVIKWRGKKKGVENERPQKRSVRQFKIILGSISHSGKHIHTFIVFCLGSCFFFLHFYCSQEGFSEKGCRRDARATSREKKRVRSVRKRRVKKKKKDVPTES